MKRILFFLLIISACTESKKTTVVEQPVIISRVDAPAFIADSSFYFIEKQLSFGYRIPGTEAHKNTGDYLVSKLEGYGAKIYQQEFSAETWDGNNIPLRNIIASFQTDKPGYRPYCGPRCPGASGCPRRRGLRRPSASYPLPLWKARWKR